ncbi:MAG: hypothetical protein HC795_11325 [Coleofasciculaceae cyanobacterium RL_1_1]|nr:hypothetical protein [Coleofasciculaceae cyanobacterium RL_1_1]
MTLEDKPSGDRLAAIAAIARLRVAIKRLQAELDLAQADGQRREHQPIESVKPKDADTSANTLAEIQAAIARWQIECDSLSASMDRDTRTIAILVRPLWVNPR